MDEREKQDEKDSNSKENFNEITLTTGPGRQHHNKWGLATFCAGRLESIDRLLTPVSRDGAIDSLKLHASTIEVVLQNVKHYLEL